jgi:hypothetical protein
MGTSCQSLMREFNFLKRKKRRKYPIKLDEEGRSARRRCFEMFALKESLQEIARKLDIKLDTVRRYHLQWKKDPRFEVLYQFTKSLFNKINPERDRNLELFASAWGYSTEQLEHILSQPYGLRRLMARKIKTPSQADADRKMRVALELALLFSDFLTKEDGQFTDIFWALHRLMREAADYRRQADERIEKQNEFIALIHRILEIDMERERRGRVKPDRLSAEERDTLIRDGIKKAIRKMEASYWLRIGELMGEGFTEEESREKLYQNMLESGDARLMDFFYKFQDEVHHRKKDGPSVPL